MTNQNLFRAAIAFLLTGLTCACSIGEDQVANLKWSELKKDGQLKTGKIIQREGLSELLHASNAGPAPLNLRLATLETTGISKTCFRIRGRIHYKGVAQPGYLEMWSQFAGGGRYFSRTLSSDGPMRTIHGDSESREFILPFKSSAENGPPTRIEINLVLPAAGEVWLSEIDVHEFDEDEWEYAILAEGAWWGGKSAGLIGAIMGPLLGIIGAIIGTLTSRGRAKNVCVALCWFAIALGVCCLTAGVIALLQSQSYAVYFPLLLIGTIATAVMGGLLPTTYRRFAEVELRKMESMDVGVA
jgi:hypothetical protein